MNGKRTFPLIATILVPVAVAVGLAYSGGQASGAVTAGEPREATGNENRRAVLEFGGDRGTEFSGTCAVDGEKRKFGGEVPERLKAPDGGRMECEVRKRGPGDLELTFTVGENTRSVQRISSSESKTEIRYEDDGLSVSTSSSGGADSSSQQTIVSGSSQSSQLTIVSGISRQTSP